MFRPFLIALLGAGVSLFCMAGPALAGAMPSKGLKVDPLLEKAILDSAKAPEKQVDDVVAVPPEEEGPPAPEPEPKAVPVELHLPTFPKYVEPKKEPPPQFPWPKEPGKLTWGGLRFKPSLMLRTGSNDNIYAVTGRGDTDYVTYINPRVSIDIPDIRHRVELDASLEQRVYYNESDETQTNSHVKLDGALNAEHGVSVPFTVDWTNDHEERQNDLTHQMPIRPLAQHDLKMTGGIQFKPGPFGIALLGHYHRQRYENDFSRLNGQPVIRNDADRDIPQFEFNTSFDLDPQNTLILWGTYGKRAYLTDNYQNGGYTGPRRTSSTYSGMMSWIFDSPSLSGHISFGLDAMNYKDVSLHDERAFVADAEFNHKIRDNITANVQLARTVEEDVEVINPLLHTRAGLYFDYRPWDDIFLAAGSDYNFLEFTNSTREDQTLDFRVIADYFWNDFLSFGLEYDRTERNSSTSAYDFNRNQILLRMRGRL